MRTTLKRGIGRGAALNGNGNGRAVLPPTSPAVTIYRQPEPSRRGVAALVLKGFLWLLAGIVSVVVSLAGGYYVWLHEVPTSLQAVSRDVVKAQKDLGIPVAGKPTIALVVGYDKRKGVESEINGSRSDTIMLIRSDPETNSISMMSFPRDLQVLNYCPGHAAFLDRINAAYSMCGAAGTLATVKHLTGINVNYLITVNFAGFKQVVDKVGGVWVDVDRRYFNSNTTGYDRYATINLQPGYQKLNGRDALDYVRFRHTDSDLYRLARQQLFIRAMKEQISHSFLPLSIPRIVGAITRNHNVQIGAGGGKTVDFDTIKSYGFAAYKTPSGHIFTSTIQGLTGQNELAAPQSEIDAAVQDFLNPDVEAPEKAGAVALGKKPRLKTGPRPTTVPVLILNGNGVSGSATTAGAQLQAKGYPIILPANGAPANAPRWDYARTKIYFDPRQPSSRPAAKRLAILFGQADVGPIPATIKLLQNGAMEIVVVGATYTGKLAPAPRDQTPTRQPPDVRSDPGASRPYLDQVKRKVHFPLQLPTVLDAHSRPDFEVPVRSYWIGKHRAVRLTYKTSLDVAGYWGIEQTDWADPPLLDKPNRTIVRKGRRYDLYFNGAHLHVVALREKKASYWVTNTLLNTLSNETMLAIARSLRPLGSAK